MKYYDVFAERGYHSAFMTTYAFGAQAFEDIPFTRLRGSGCRNIVVLADRKMVNQSFAELGVPKFAGSSYHLVKAVAPGAFHPKISLLVGAKKGRLLVGSANLTALGLAGNKELVASLAYTEEAPEYAPLFADALTYIRSKVPSDDAWFATAMQRAIRAAPWLREALEKSQQVKSLEQITDLLFDRSDATILDQIAAKVGSDTIGRLIIVSPYWDMKLEGLARLKEMLGSPPTDLLLDVGSTGFPKSELSRFTDLGLFSVDASDSKRFVHAKLIIAEGRSWDHVISGSMNCTLPALLGPTVVGGNAEAGIYKRVPVGTALVSLSLERYREAPLQPEELHDPILGSVSTSTNKGFFDGGTLTLQSSRIYWKAPTSLATRPATALLLSDRKEEPVRNPIELTQGGDTNWHVDVEEGRPKSGVILFADGSVSAPVQVVDLDVLAVRTQPPAQGRKKSLTDILAEAMNEDLILIEALNQLEALEFDQNETTAEMQTKATPSQALMPEELQHAILPYEEFVRARTEALAQGQAFGGIIHRRQESPAHTLSAALNRIVGLVGVDLNADDEREMDAMSAMDFRLTEPEMPEDVAKTMPSEGNSKPAKATKQALATAKKMKEAVDAFEERCRALEGKLIGTAELVRLRALLQILLSHAQPVRGSALATQILPVHTKNGYDWPRLVGRLLRQHFGTARALQTLRVSQDESEQKRVIEYLATADWAAKAAVDAAVSNTKTADLRKPLTTLAKALTAQVTLIVSLVEEDKRYFNEMTSRLDERFAEKLALNLRAEL